MNSTEDNGFSRTTVAFGISLAAASVVNALLVVAKEKVPFVMAALQKMTGHHWISQSSLVLAVFGLGGGVLALGGRPVLSANALTRVLVAGVVTASAIIFGFYLTNVG